MKLKIKQSQGDHIDIDVSNEETFSHLTDPKNFVAVILNQFEKDIYGIYFKGKKNLTVLDLGGNIGLFSIHVSDSCNKIYTVEPTPSHYKILLDNIKNIKQIVPLNYAISDSDEPVEFFISSNNSTMNSLIDRSGAGNSVKVQGIRLKSLIDTIEEDKIDFCKIDIEGSEFKTITFQAISDIKSRVDNFFIEFHEENGMNFDQASAHFSFIFESNGYTTKRLNHDTIFAFKNEQANS